MKAGTTTLDTIERAAESVSRYTKRLSKTFGQKEAFCRHLARISEFARLRRLSDASYEVLREHEPYGIIYVEVERRFRDLHHTAAANLLQLLLDTVSDEPSEASYSRWRQFFQSEFAPAMRSAYERWVKRKPSSALVLEITSRKLLAEGAQTWWRQAPGWAAPLREEITRRFSRELNGYFHHIRSSVCAKLPVNDALIAESIGKTYITAIPLEDIKIQTIAGEIRQCGIPALLFERTSALFFQTLRDRVEADLLQSIKRASVGSRSDLANVSSTRLVDLSDKAAERIETELQVRGRLMAEQCTKRIAELSQELDDGRKRLRHELRKGFHDAEELLAFVDESRSLESLAQRVRQRSTWLGESLAKELASLENVRRSLDTAKRSLANAESLERITAADVRELLLGSARSRESDLGAFIDQFGMLLETVGSSFENIPEETLKSLENLIASTQKEIRLELRNLTDLNRSSGALRATVVSCEQDIQLLENLGGDRDFLGRKRYHIRTLLDRWRHVMEEVVAPFVISRVLDEMVKFWPPTIRGLETLTGSAMMDEARYVGEALEYNNLFYRLTLDGEGTPEPGVKVAVQVKEPAETSEEREQLGGMLVRHFSRTVAVIVYDIRGSSFMGAKLFDADKESQIRIQFNRLMMKIARRNNAFVLKDTGDGGILWFGGNSRELYDASYEMKQTRSGELVRQATGERNEVGIEPSERSGEWALRCARDMVLGAEEFVAVNIQNYGDWFKDVDKRELSFAGVAFASLPPEYKRIFQIGVGIASGQPGRDLTFHYNAFGDPDLTGQLVREANVYSTARDPSRSVILCDGATLLNFLLNCEEFAARDVKSVRLENLPPQHIEDLLKREVTRLAEIKKTSVGYQFESLGIGVDRIGLRLIYQGKHESPYRLTTGTDDIQIDEYAKLYDASGGTTKLLYEVYPIRRGPQDRTTRDGGPST